MENLTEEKQPTGLSWGGKPINLTFLVAIVVQLVTIITFAIRLSDQVSAQNQHLTAQDARLDRMEATDHVRSDAVNEMNKTVALLDQRLRLFLEAAIPHYSGQPAAPIPAQPPVTGKKP